jgi:hypothetical protein
VPRIKQALIISFQQWIPDFDLEGDNRTFDGDQDSFAVVDIGADGYAGVKMQQAIPRLLLHSVILETLQAKVLSAFPALFIILWIFFAAFRANQHIS